jgi:hypothetical protein
MVAGSGALRPETSLPALRSESWLWRESAHIAYVSGTMRFLSQQERTGQNWWEVGGA